MTLSLYNLMAVKMIDKLEIAYMSFYASYTVVMELDMKKKVEEGNFDSRMVAEAERKRSL